ncbi:MAG: GWxTD domain-containing protein [Nitrospinae bacterium]|nr:GWxTD domain-containing protein [Nitrospinota bacterium]
MLKEDSGKDATDLFPNKILVEVRALQGPLALSDITLLEDYDEQSQTIFPLVGSRIDASELSFQIFYEIYADQPRRVRVVREVFPMRKSRGSRLIRSLLGLKNKEADAVVLYSDEEVTALDRGRHQIVASIPLQELLEVGEYLVQVRLEDENGQQLAVSERAFSTRWTGLAAHLLDLDEAIDQLAYIAKPKDIRAFKEAPTEGERLKRFEEFWKKRDPTPRTGRNERMEEYYYRIDYANRVFGSIVPGWKTDRGHVLMEFGYPDLIDRQTYSFGAEPWEVWYYYRIARQYIFVDKTGFGDYELMVPIWDERTRIR